MRPIVSEVCGFLAPAAGQLHNAQLHEAIEWLLPERAQYVLVRRYGLDNREPATLAKLSEELDVSMEQVRQIQLKAERILKAA